MNHNSQSPRRTILELLLHKEFTPKQLANKTDLSVSTIRTHLKTLQDKNYVEHYFKRANRGRPKKVYKITDQGRGTFPRNYSLILSNLLLEMENELKEEKIQELLENAAVIDMDNNFLKKDRETRLDELVEFCDDELNLYPSLEEEDGYYLLEFENCGCLEIEEEVHEHLCYMCKQAISNFVPNSEVKQLKRLQEDDDFCLHKIEPNEND